MSELGRAAKKPKKAKPNSLPVFICVIFEAVQLMKLAEAINNSEFSTVKTAVVLSVISLISESVMSSNTNVSLDFSCILKWNFMILFDVLIGNRKNHWRMLLRSKTAELQWVETGTKAQWPFYKETCRSHRRN